jgi:hypothetical protein
MLRRGEYCENQQVGWSIGGPGYPYSLNRRACLFSVLAWLALRIWEEEVLYEVNPYSRSTEIRMRSFLINKNVSFYYWLKKRIGKERAYRAASVIEKAILIFGRDQAEQGKNRGV